MKLAKLVLAAIGVVAGAIGSIAPVHAGTILEGTVFAGSTLFDTGPQTSPLTSDNLNWTFTCTTCSGFGLSGDGSAKIVNGSLGVRSTVSVTGTPSASYSATTHSYAQFGDVLTITGGTGSGVLQLQYSLDGVASHTGAGSNDGSIGFGVFGTSSFYQLNGGPLIHASGPSRFGDGTKNDTVTFFIPFTYDTAFSVDTFLVTGATFAASLDTTPWGATWDFYNTASLDSALVFGGTPQSLGARNDAAGIAASSGLIYGPNGITSIPEPGTMTLFWAGLAGLGALRLRRSKA